MRFANGWAALSLRPVVLAVGAILWPLCGQSVTIRHDQPDQDYRDLASNPAYSCVGRFVNDWGYSGSATLIAPDWILTAAHNLDAATSGRFTLGGVAYDATGFIRCPGYRSGNLMAGYDFALVHLGSSVSAVLPAKLYSGSAAMDQTATFVGFGMTGTGRTGYRTVDDLARAFQNSVDGQFGDPGLLLGADFDDPQNPAESIFGSPTPLALEGCVAPGDSGGGVFITIGSDTYLAGVISFVAATDALVNADYGDVSGFGLVSAVLPWIEGSIVPEPSATALLLAGSLSLIASRWGPRRARRRGSHPRARGLNRQDALCKQHVTSLLG